MKPQNILTTFGALVVSALMAHAQDAATPAPATTAPETQTTTAQPAPATEAQPAPAAAETAPAAAAPAASAVIPLIVIDDTPLLDAIRNLARQAGINLMIDPKVAYGQPDPAKPGAVTAQPSVSIRWENITAEQALSALLSNYGLQAVAEPKIHITRVTVKDPAAPDPLVTETIQLKFASPSNVLAAVTASLNDKRSKVVADVRTSQLVVVATEKELVGVRKLIEQLDSQTKQVLIEAKLYETSISPKTVKGLDWSETLGSAKDKLGNGQTIKFGNNPSGAVTMSDANGAFKFDPSTAFLSANGISAVLSFLNQSSDAKVIATPRAVTLDNETAELSVTRAFPIFKNTAGTQGSPGGSEVTYTNLGVLLKVTPRISANNFVNLRVEPEVSSVFDTARKVVSDTVNEADIYDIRKIQTTVMIPSGNTLVLGGLVRDSINTGHVKVPVLGDIPGLGSLFRKDSKSRDKSNLLIFITPTIVADSDYQPANSTFLKSTAVEIEDPEWSAWDSGKPRDWSKKGGFDGPTK